MGRAVLYCPHMPNMMNATPPGTMPAKTKSSPNILEWLLVVLMLATLAGVGYLYLTLTQLNDSVMSAKSDVMTMKTELMAQKQAMEEREVMEANAEMEVDSMAGWLTYSSEEYTFRYPPSYTVEPATDSFRVLTLQGDRGRIELWKFSDLPDRAIDFGDTDPTPEQLNVSLPQQSWALRTSSVDNGKIFSHILWLFYTDDETRDELQRIANTIQ